MSKLWGVLQLLITIVIYTWRKCIAAIKRTCLPLYLVSVLINVLASPGDVKSLHTIIGDAQPHRVENTKPDSLDVVQQAVNLTEHGTSPCRLGGYGQETQSWSCPLLVVVSISPSWESLYSRHSSEALPLWCGGGHLVWAWGTEPEELYPP